MKQREHEVLTKKDREMLKSLDERMTTFFFEMGGKLEQMRAKSSELEVLDLIVDAEGILEKYVQEAPRPGGK